MAVTRRVFIKGGLAALALTACGRTGLSGTTTTSAAPGSTATTVAPVTTTTLAQPASTTIPGDTVVDVMGSYEIVDLDTGTEVRVTVADGYRTIVANGLPDHATGDFPNAGNPNAIAAQSYEYRLPIAPDRSVSATAYNVPQSFGIAVNGVPFDPYAAEWWQRDRASGWQYEALGGGIELGLDASNAHVQPSGAYHYHGMPTGLVGTLDSSQHGPLVGWAFDGFPIYAGYGYVDPDDPGSGVVDLVPSYRVIDGTRPSGPGGAHDGTFVEDYEHVAGLGDLDECNGRFARTPEYPDGTYLYVLTSAFPVIPRCFAGTIADSAVAAPGRP